MKKRDVIFFIVSLMVLINLSRCTKKTEPENIKNENYVKKTEQQSPTTTPLNDSAFKPSFIQIVPVTFHPKKQDKILLNEKDITSLKVSPNGQNIVYTGTQDSRRTICLIDLLTGNRTSLKINFNDVRDASWYADGSRIVFAGELDDSWEIYVYELGNQELFQITSDKSRKKSWPRCSPYKFDGYYRIIYVSEVNNRKDIWWVRGNGQYDMPITQANPKYDSCAYWDTLMPAPLAITAGGDFPEWSPSGNLLLYRTSKGYRVLSYSYFTWWKEKPEITIPKAENALISWSPNQTSFLLHDMNSKSAFVVSRNSLKQHKVTAKPITSIDYFPDGQGFACGTHDGNQYCIEISPFDDPLGDVTNLWMYPYSETQRTKIAANQLLFLDSGFNQIYNIYETERYYCGSVDPNFPARPYIITSDAILETFYAAFASLYGAMEHFRLESLLKEFSRMAVKTARERNISKEITVYFETALGLLDPGQRETISNEATIEIERIEKGQGLIKSLWEREVDYSDFYIRGKYEDDTAAQNYFRAIKWFQAFTFDMDSVEDRKIAAEINAVTSAPQVFNSLKKTYSIYQQMVGESRYLNPLNAAELFNGGKKITIEANLPWITIANKYRLFPSIATLDFHIFNELVTHTERPVTVGTIENPRLLPKGLDIMACLGSDEALGILCKEFQVDLYDNYLTTLISLREHIRDYGQEFWGANLYQQWLYALKSLISQTDYLSPSFMKTTAWKRKQLNTALASWVNLRYETIAVVEQASAECGEGGYEELNIGKPKGYVEPDPEFFRRIDDGFSKINDLMAQAFDDSALAKAAQNRITEFRGQIQSLGRMAEKELKGIPLNDDEYSQILEIGGTIEQFILIMGSLKGDESGHAIGLPDPISKIVDVQKAPDGTRLYEAIGNANEINVIVPYAGRRQIAKGSVYSYYEFTSNKQYTNTMWREEPNPQLPSWIKLYYNGCINPSLDQLPDLK